MGISGNTELVNTIDNLSDLVNGAYIVRTAMTDIDKGKTAVQVARTQDVIKQRP